MCSSRARTAALLVTLGLAAAGAPASAAASSGGKGDRRICVDKVAVYDAPGGFVVAHLYRPQKLRVLNTAQHRKWSLVRFDSGSRGWIPTSKICR